MARETQKEKIARLETELAQAINQRDAAIADALALNSKLNAKHDVSDSPMYQSLLRDREQWKRVAKDRQDQIEKNRQRYGELVAMYEDLERQLKESQDKNKTVKTDKNPFGAGRKRAYIEYAKQIEKLHKDGLSIRKISKELCIPSATIARYIKASYQNNLISIIFFSRFLIFLELFQITFQLIHNFARVIVILTPCKVLECLCPPCNRL